MSQAAFALLRARFALSLALLQPRHTLWRPVLLFARMTLNSVSGFTVPQSWHTLSVFGLPPASGVLYGVQAAPSTPQPAPDAALAGDNPRLKRPLTRYRVDFVLRAEDVILKLNPQGGRTGRILVGLKAYGGDGNAVNWQQSMETLNVNAAAYETVQKTGIPAHFEIDLPA